jgi:trehalose 6-phosphate synthase
MRIVLAQDLSFLKTRWMETFLRTLLVTWFGAVGVFLLIATQVERWFKGYLRFLYQGLRAAVAGRRPPTRSSDLDGLTPDIETLAAKILKLPVNSRAGTAQENPLSEALRKTVDGRNVVVFANREPYIHQWKNDKIEVLRPASGLVTALEPVLRESGGMWIGHGSGSADRETVNSSGEIAVPPGRSRYTLKRVWLSAEEEKGYYYGFSNEGLWPLCHLAHTRPTFRLTDWQQYCSVNQKFCDETPESVVQGDSLVLVQDYHFAMLPAMLRKRAKGTKTKISLFWHIPWPNPEAFGICPWYKELLMGMLGSDLIGFHTQYHCNNFLETCDRYLECRVDWERFSVTIDNHETLIRAFPIGIDTSPVRSLSDEEIRQLRARYGIKADIVAVGVDRVDYTKGLVERVEAVECFLAKHPEYIGRFSLVQMGSPSRTHIPAYRLLGEQLEAAVKRVNERFGTKDDPSGYQPVVFVGQHEWDDIQYFYQMGDLCMVTSLHDGMNLVAKEYVWCQKPDRGMLILSKFTGASRELSDALIVNPYSTEEMADAIATALAMPKEERTRRMRSMREKVEGHNAFQWASELIRTLVQDVRTEAQPLGRPTPLRRPSFFSDRMSMRSQ